MLWYGMVWIEEVSGELVKDNVGENLGGKCYSFLPGKTSLRTKGAQLPTAKYYSIRKGMQLPVRAIGNKQNKFWVERTKICSCGD